MECSQIHDDYISKSYCYKYNKAYVFVGEYFNFKEMKRLLIIERYSKPNTQLKILYDDNVASKSVDFVLKRLNIISISETFLDSCKDKVEVHCIIGSIILEQNHYIGIVSKCELVAKLFCHSIYQVSNIMYIPLNTKKIGDIENKYLKILIGVDLTTDFFFSRTYNLENTLQENYLLGDSNAENTIDKEKIKNESKMYIWNDYLLQNLQITNVWIGKLVHGSIKQFDVSIDRNGTILTLISRRSYKYAGPRYLKRGINLDGFVANQVESEQIVHKSNSCSMFSSNFTSFVQVRGSVPLFWSQKANTITLPRTPIQIELNDQTYASTAAHFSKLMLKYDNPIFVLDLLANNVNKKEYILAKLFRDSIEYLNQFVPKKAQINYVSIDMSFIKKNKSNKHLENVFSICNEIFKKIGLFSSVHVNDIHLTPNVYNFHEYYSKNYRITLQKGVVRTNCLDCLDRTNSCQYIFGLAVLNYQLKLIGLNYELSNPFYQNIIGCLEELYELHGNKISLQYGGSNLTHKIQAYRKNSSNIQNITQNVFQATSRFLNNTFQGYEKQISMNLFLGIFRCNNEMKETEHIWSYECDLYFHNPQLTSIKNFIDFNEKLKSININPTRWFNSNYSCQNENVKTQKHDILNKISPFEISYQPTNPSSLQELCSFNPSLWQHGHSDLLDLFLSKSIKSISSLDCKEYEDRIQIFNQSTNELLKRLNDQTKNALIKVDSNNSPNYNHSKSCEDFYTLNKLPKRDGSSDELFYDANNETLNIQNKAQNKKIFWSNRSINNVEEYCYEKYLQPKSFDFNPAFNRSTFKITGKCESNTNFSVNKPSDYKIFNKNYNYQSHACTSQYEYVQYCKNNKMRFKLLSNEKIF